jgi:pyruvate formate lyase activating enzyme
MIYDLSIKFLENTDAAILYVPHTWGIGQANVESDPFACLDILDRLLNQYPNRLFVLDTNDIKYDQSELKGLIFNIQRFSLQDGPGIRTTVFFKGCPLNCRWCHNPEGIKHSPEILHKSFSCVLCGKCIKSCPKSAISLVDDSIIINRSKCDLCGICREVCNTNSLEICGEFFSASEILRKVIADREFYNSSNGGVTLSGGEPLAQYEFLRSLLPKLKENELHVCLDTSGLVKTERFQKTLDKIDMVLFDVKTFDDGRHKELTGVSNKLILRNLIEILNYDVDVIIRTPIITGYNFIDLSNELHKHIESLLNLGCSTFELIPYHRFGEQKYQMLGLNYDIKIDSNSQDLIQEIARQLKKEFSVRIKINQPILT